MSVFRTLAALTLSCFVLLRPGETMAEECQSWQEIRPYIQKFYELEGTHKDQLVSHFNAVSPRTDFHPGRVGYAWFTGESLVQLYMINGDCVVLKRYYPRKVVWKLMGDGPGSGLDFDKSGDSYAKDLEQRKTEQDKALERIQKRQKEIRAEEIENEMSGEDEELFNQDIN